MSKPSKTTLLGLRTAIYPVSDLAKGKQFYSAAFETEPYFDQPFYVGYAVGGFELGLIPDGKSTTDGAQAYWGVKDAGAAYERLLSLGAQTLEPPHEVGEGIKVGAVKDPFGNRLCIIENPLFKTSEVR